VKIQVYFSESPHHVSVESRVGTTPPL